MNTKLCPRCKQEKGTSEFRKNKSRYDGLDSYCKLCRQNYMKQDRDNDPQRYRNYYNKWREENTEQARENYKEWHSKNKEKRLSYQKSYYEENRERINAVTLKGRHKNIEHHREVKRNWYKKNPQATIRINHRRRAQAYNSGGDYTKQEFESLCAKYDYRCLRCGKKTKLTVDHIVPLSKGGSNSIDNIQPLCKKCNSKKWTSSTDYRT